MIAYKLTSGTTVLRQSDGAVIPDDIRNTAYQEYLQWVAIGGVPEPADVVVPAILPISVTPWQIRKALNATALRASVEAAVAAADQTTQDAWQYALEFRRNNALVINLGLALGKTEQELDAMFALAQTL